MTDPVAATAAAPPPELAAANAPHAPFAQAPQFDPGETRMFANMMQGAPQTAAAGASTGLHDTAMAYAQQLGGNVNSYEDMRRGMLSSIDLSDPIKTMFVMTDYSMQAHTMFAKLHISTGLASAATSLFGTLLKNQQ